MRDLFSKLNKKQKILIVDDEELLLNSLSAGLKKAGYTILKAGSLEEMEKILEDSLPDLILMDVFLPDGNGLRFSQKLLSQDKFSGIPCIIMSGGKHTDFRETNKDIPGILEFIRKPIQLTDLIRTINLVFKIKETEEKRLNLELRFKQFSENISDMVFLLNAEGIIESLNPAFHTITGRNISEWTGDSFSELIYPLHREKWNMQFQKAMEGIPPLQQEIFLKNADGSILPLNVLLNRVMDMDSDSIKVFGIAADLRTGNNSDEKDSLQKEVQCWEKLSDSNSGLTQKHYQLSAFNGEGDEIFRKFVREYKKIIESALDSNIYQLKKDDKILKMDFADELGFLKAGPKDLIRIHSCFFQNLKPQVNQKKLEKIHEEARLVLLEIMGYLVNYYRNRNTLRNEYL